MPRGRFVTTRWSLILDASANESPEALAAVCRVYWYPVYAYVRRQQYPHEEAEDLTQGFFERLLENNYLAAADRTRGRFRSFLLAAVRHHLSHERERARTQKRGGDVSHVSLDADDHRRRFEAEVAAGLTPEQLFERQWALEVLDSVLEVLRSDYQAAGRGEEFELLAPVLTGFDGDAPRDEIAARLGLSPGALRVAIHRLRRRFQALLRAAVAATVSDDDAVDDEIRHLAECLALRG